MRALRLAWTAPEAAFIEHDIPRPKPGKGEVLILVRAAGITPTELAWYPTTHTRDGAVRTGAVLCHEFAGEIVEIGEGVENLEVEDSIYGMNDWFAEGALAEYCLTQPGSIAPKPERLNHTEAASVPISALTAWQGLFDRAKLKTGERLLILGGAGTVGIFAIQLARRRGAHVIVTASANDLEFARKLGADEAFDYHAEPLKDQIRNVDVVFDAVGGEALQRSLGVLNPNGRVVTIAADSGDQPGFFIVEPNRDQLIEVGKLIDAGELETFVSAAVPLDEASDAYTGQVEHKGRGKLVAVIEP
jgi:NADPH:quinone reductase-like Zn-dependent oxidoreductase